MKHAIFSSLATLCLMAMNGASLTPAASTDRNHAATETSQADRAGFPAGYRTDLKLLAVKARADGSEIMTAFANSLASSSLESGKLPYPDGAVIVMEFAEPARDGEGQVLRDSAGQPLTGEVLHVDVMRRGEGFGAAYGESRAGNWEFASYSREGKTLIAPAAAGHCAACHQKAGAEKDFVFRSRSRTDASAARGD